MDNERCVVCKHSIGTIDRRSALHDATFGDVVDAVGTRQEELTSALYDACLARNLAGVVAAVDQGADTNKCYDTTPLCSTIEHSPGKSQNFTEVVAIVTFLITKGANPELRDSSQRTPLFHAVKFFNVEIVRVLLAFGAKRDCTDTSGITLQHILSNPRGIGGVSQENAERDAIKIIDLLNQ